MIMIEVLMLVEVLMRAGKVAYGAEHDNEGIGIVKMLNLGQERLQDICLVLANAGEQGQVETHLVILVEIVFNSINKTYRLFFNELLYRGDIPCCNPIGQGGVDDVVLRHVLENAQDGVHHDAHLFKSQSNSIVNKDLWKRGCAITQKQQQQCN